MRESPGLFGRRDDGRWLGNLLSEDIALDPPGKPHGQLVVDELFRWDREDLCRDALAK